jgi:chaperone required for assembly of F1-ATPase
MAHAARMKRFWKEVATEPADGGWRVTLDGRPMKTQGGAPQIVPTVALAELLAAEWRAQGDEIDPAAFPARDTADYAIDMVAYDKPSVVAKILRYGETDTLCYRADPDEPLHKRQWAEWEPVVTAFEAREGVRMERVSGIVHKPQPAATLATLKARLEALDPFTLAALEVLTSLSASLTVGLSALELEADPDVLWRAAELEEAWQVELWGSDWEAEERRKRRKADFLRAVEFARASDSGD